MPVWLWIALVWAAAASLFAWGFARFQRWLRGDFDRHYDRDE